MNLATTLQKTDRLFVVVWSQLDHEVKRWALEVTRGDLSRLRLADLTRLAVWSRRIAKAKASAHKEERP